MNDRASERDAYLRICGEALDRKDRDQEIQRYCTPICPECGMNALDMTQVQKDWHDWYIDANGRVTTIILIACEGYWVINPRKLGMAGPQEWSDWTEPQDT